MQNYQDLSKVKMTHMVIGGTQVYGITGFAILCCKNQRLCICLFFFVYLSCYMNGCYQSCKKKTDQAITCRILRREKIATKNFILRLCKGSKKARIRYEDGLILIHSDCKKTFISKLKFMILTVNSNI